MTGVVGAMGSSMGLVGHSRQRSSGTSVAQERLERAHSIPFNDVALDADEVPQIADSTTAGHPDNDVSTDGTKYKGEPLIITASGGLKHLDDPFKLANTEFTVHQYVTWAESPDIKRVTVIVTWKFPVSRGRSPRDAVDARERRRRRRPGRICGARLATPAPANGGGTEGDLGRGTCVGPLGGDPILNPLNPIFCPPAQSNPTIVEMIVLSGSGTEQGYLNSTAVEVRIKAQTRPASRCICGSRTKRRARVA